MSYDLAVWVGPRPSTKEDAAAEYERRMDEREAVLEEETTGDMILDFLAGLPDVDVAPEIQEFVEAALELYPELDEDPGDESSWAASPLLDEAIGDLLYFPLTIDGAAFARDVLAELAASLGLVCYDPQIECLLPDPDATPASVMRDQFFDYLEGSATPFGPQEPPSWIRNIFRR